MASNSLDEWTIQNILMQGAKLDSFGVGERLITSKSSPVFGGVYKLVGIEEADGNIRPSIKISENVSKITTPGFKNLYRIYDKKTGKAEADLITLHDEKIDESKPIELFHPIYTWKRKTFKDYYIKPLLVQIYREGKLIYKKPTLEEIRERAKNELDSLWDEVKRLENPHEYIVDLSQKLWEVKDTLLKEHREK